MQVMYLPILSYCLLLLGVKQCASATNQDDVVNNSTSIGNDQGLEDCKCVPYFKCNGPTRSTRITGKCDDDFAVCCEPDHQVKYNAKQNRGCGRRNPKGVGFYTNNDGVHAQFGEFPWMVALLGRESIEGKLNESWSYKCGASLIHPQVVLTAAHCISDNYKLYKIRAGEWDTQTENELYPHQERNVKTIIVHPEYNKKLVYHDYVLLILEYPVERQDNVDVVCLPAKDEIIDNLLCYSNGWGKDNFGIKGKYQALLGKVHIPIVDKDTCQTSLRTTRLGTHFNLHESFLCAGGQPDQDTCKEDGGSPLVCPIRGKENTYFQTGVVSWGIHCGRVPRVYANVAKAVDWIDRTMTNNGFETSSYKY